MATMLGLGGGWEFLAFQRGSPTPGHLGAHPAAASVTSPCILVPLWRCRLSRLQRGRALGDWR